MDDNRILWLKCTIANMLGVYEPEYVNAAIYENLYDFKSFLNDKYTKNEDINKIILYIWRTFYDKLVEEEITVLEEVPQEPPLETEKKDKKNKKGKGKGGAKEKEIKANVKESKGKTMSKAKTKSSAASAKTVDTDAERQKAGDDSTFEADTGIESATDDMGAESVKSSALSGSKKSGKGKGKRKKRKTLLAPSPVYVEVKKIIPTFVKTPIIHCYFGELKSTHFDNNIKYIYIIRKEINGIPFYADINKCFAEMSQHFIFGTVRNPLIDSVRMDLEKANKRFKNIIK